MRKILRAFVMVLAFCVPALAGDILCPPVAPLSSPAVQEPIMDGEINTGVTAPPADGDMANEAALTFMQVVLNLLALP
jgi:hypothetical protein